MSVSVQTRKQRLRKLENEIRSGMEEFYYTGMKLKEIRDDELYKEDGFATWEKYCRERWESVHPHVTNLIVSSEYRQKLPNCSTGAGKWTERAVREFQRIPDKRQAARVAEKVLKEVESKSKSEHSLSRLTTAPSYQIPALLGVLGRIGPWSN